MKLKLLVLTIALFVSTFSQFLFSKTITWEKNIIDDNVLVLGNLAIGNPYIEIFPTPQNYLYCSDVDSHLIEYRYENNQWIKDTVVMGRRFQRIVIGDGRNDAHERIYAFRFEKLYEIWYENFSWHENLILEMPDNCIRGIVIGEGKNDDTNRIYLTAGYGKIFELTFTGTGHSDWQIEIINQDMYCQTIGQGRNDGVNRIYGFGGDCNRTIYELTYNSVGEIWEREEVFTYVTDIIDIPCGGLKIGKARNNDDFNRLYWFDVYNYINETTWNGISWDNQLVRTIMPNPSGDNYYAPFIFNLINLNKMFIVHRSGFIYYFVNDNNWNRYYVGEVIDPILGIIPLVYGNVRNKDALYAASLGNRIIEFYPHNQ